MTKTSWGKWRASYFTLLALCTERLNDRRRRRSPDDEGWIDRQVLAESCALTPTSSRMTLSNATYQGMRLIGSTIDTSSASPSA